MANNTNKQPKSSGRKKIITYLDPKDYRNVQKAAQNNRLSASHQVAKVLQDWLKNQEQATA